jgi:hypothetical protein
LQFKSFKYKLDFLKIYIYNCQKNPNQFTISTLIFLIKGHVHYFDAEAGRPIPKRKILSTFSTFYIECLTELQTFKFICCTM